MLVKMLLIVVGLIAVVTVNGTTTITRRPSISEEEEETATSLGPTETPMTRRGGFQWLHLKQGYIFSQVQVSADGQSEYYAFKGIPYAQPPIGHLRFKDPVVAGTWNEPRNGSFMAPMCPQINKKFFLTGNITTVGDEDCLYLNVFTTKPNNNNAMPVMVFLHGGGFSRGGMDIYPPEPLVTRGIVLVTLQYRLGTLGFLSTEDFIIPGNLGLKDQSLALQWVQENIREFGGDPLRVTLFGESAGGASAHFHVLSPFSQGLFHRAILQSGTAMCGWSVVEDHRDVAIKVGQKFNCSGANSLLSDPVRSSQKLLSCLQKVSAEDLVLTTYDFEEWIFLPNVMMPRVDGIFLPHHPAKLLKEDTYNKVDLISGIMKDEMALYTKYIFSKPETLAGLTNNLTTVGPIALLFDYEGENRVYLAKRAFYHYLGNSPLNEEKAQELKELISDRSFRICHDEASYWHSRDAVFGNNIYRYEFHHQGKYTNMNLVNGTLGETWVPHGDDLMYLFHFTEYPFALLERDSDLFVSYIMLTLWTNFAATGNPTPNQSLGFRWTPMRDNDYSYLAITTAPSMMDDHRHKVREFWKNLPLRENKILYPDLFTGSQEQQG